MTNQTLEPNRRAVLGTLLVGAGSVMAGCSRSSIEGTVVENETSLALSHEYGIQATSSGTRVVVDLTITNDGSEQINRSHPRAVRRGLSARFWPIRASNSSSRAAN